MEKEPRLKSSSRKPIESAPREVSEASQSSRLKTSAPKQASSIPNAPYTASVRKPITKKPAVYSEATDIQSVPGNLPKKTPPQKPKKRRLALKITAIILAVLLGVGVIFAGIIFGMLDQMKLDKEVVDVLDKPITKDKINILLLGVDESGDRSDTIMLFTVDTVKNEMKLLSIPRDTKVSLSNGKVTKINACIGFERREAFVIETIRTLTGMPIHYYCEVNFEGFKEIIDILGGVDYNVPFDMNYDDPAQDLHIHLKAGYQHLDGQAAHDFVRFRHNNKDEEVYAPGDYYKGDIGRIGAQQDFLRELVRQKLKPEYLTKAFELLGAASKHVRTNLSVDAALGFANALSGSSVELETFLLPGTDKYENNVSYYIYSPSETKKLVLEKFGYPEDEAKALEEKQAKEKQEEKDTKTESTSAAPNPTSTPAPKTEEEDEPYKNRTPATSID